MNPLAWATATNACALQATGVNGPDRITKTLYDAADQVLQIRMAVGTPLEQAYATYSYSLNGKQTAVVDANGNKATLTYDGFDRQTRWTFPSKTSLTPAAIVTFTAATPVNALTLAGAPNPADYEQYTYDNNGNRTKLRKRDNQEINYSYDALNRVTVKDIPGGTAADVYYGYDLRGLQLYARYGSTSGLGVTHAYDGIGRLTSSTNTTDGVSRMLSYQYDANGNRTQLTFPDTTVVSYAYDGLNRTTEIREGTAGPIRATMAYDNNGRRSGVSRAGADSMSYVYDPASRLKTFSHGFTTTTNNLALDFEYNPASQMVKRIVSNDTYAYRDDYNLVRPYVANGLNQYTAAGPAAFTYDPNGNLTGDGGTTYAYDTENRLTNASGSKTATLKYDPLGRLNETSGGTAGVTRFLYDGDALVGEYDSNGTLLRRYIHGPGVDEPLVWYEGSTLANARSLHANHQGSIIGIADNGGALLNANSYDAYGIPALTNLGRFAYTGQIAIPELGMYHYKARIYSPTLGRFLQTDPIGYKDQINLYAYVGNDPVNKTDPEGTCAGQIGRVCQIVATKVLPALGKLGNSIARFIPGTSQRAQAVAQAAQQRLQQSNLAQHPAGWNAINTAKQTPHTEGSVREGASVLTTNATKLFDKYAGLGEAAVNTRGQAGFRERITTGGNVIGQYVNPAGTRVATDSAIIHYGRTGSHIVPAAPSEAMLRMVPFAQ